MTAHYMHGVPGKRPHRKLLGEPTRDMNPKCNPSCAHIQCCFDLRAYTPRDLLVQVQKRKTGACINSTMEKQGGSSKEEEHHGGLPVSEDTSEEALPWRPSVHTGSPLIRTTCVLWHFALSLVRM